MKTKTLSEIAAEIVTNEIAQEVIKSYLGALDELEKQADELARQIEIVSTD